LANVLWAEGKQNEAQELSRESLTLRKELTNDANPEDVDVLLALAKLVEQTNMEQALELLKEAAEQNPQNIEVLRARGRLLEKMNRLDEAVQSFTRAIELTSTNASAPQGLEAMLREEKSNLLKKMRH
jgi:Flp pilus assembly protein TadD